MNPSVDVLYGPLIRIVGFTVENGNEKTSYLKCGWSLNLECFSCNELLTRNVKSLKMNSLKLRIDSNPIKWTSMNTCWHHDTCLKVSGKLKKKCIDHLILKYLPHRSNIFLGRLFFTNHVTVFPTNFFTRHLYVVIRIITFFT